MKKITVAITVDDKMGIAFNNRRQSRDRAVIEDLVQNCRDKIYVSAYTAKLFEGLEDRVEAVGDPISECPDGGYCFVEMEHLSNHIPQISSLIVYRWNRHYPSDKALDISLDESDFKLLDRKEFQGSSHEKITKEIYIIN